MQALLKRSAQEILDEVLDKGFATVLEPLTDEMREVFDEAGVKAMTMAIPPVSETFNDLVRHVHTRAVDYSKQRSAELVGKRVLPSGKVVENPNAEWRITHATRDMLRGDVEDALQGGLSAQQLADKIRESHAFSEARARMIARTELAFAHEAGNMDGWAASGVVRGKQSLLGSEHGKDGRVDECDGNAQEGVIPFARNFSSGHRNPPYHPNCVCAVVPVLAARRPEDEEDPEDRKRRAQQQAALEEGSLLQVVGAVARAGIRMIFTSWAVAELDKVYSDEYSVDSVELWAAVLREKLRPVLGDELDADWGKVFDKVPLTERGMIAYGELKPSQAQVLKQLEQASSATKPVFLIDPQYSIYSASKPKGSALKLYLPKGSKVLPLSLFSPKLKGRLLMPKQQGMWIVDTEGNVVKAVSGGVGYSDADFRGIFGQLVKEEKIPTADWIRFFDERIAKPGMLTKEERQEAWDHWVEIMTRISPGLEDSPKFLRHFAGIEAYTTTFHNVVNKLEKVLRNREREASVDPVTDALDDLYASNPGGLQASMVVYRVSYQEGATPAHWGMMDKLALELEAGRSVYMADFGYTSTTIDRDWYQFEIFPAMLDRLGHEGGMLLDMTIWLPKGTPAFFVAPWSTMEVEQEMLVNRGARLRILRILKQANGRYKVHAVVVADDAADWNASMLGKAFGNDKLINTLDSGAVSFEMKAAIEAQKSRLLPEPPLLYKESFTLKQQNAATTLFGDKQLFADIQRHLKQLDLGPLSSSEKALVGLVQRGMKRLPSLEEPLVVYAPWQYYTVAIENALQITTGESARYMSSLVHHKLFSIREWTVSTLDEATAERRAKYDIEGPVALFRIFLPKGSKPLYLGDSQLMLPPDSQFKIVRVAKQPGSIYNVIVDLMWVK